MPLMPWGPWGPCTQWVFIWFLFRGVRGTTLDNVRRRRWGSPHPWHGLCLTQPPEGAATQKHAHRRPPATAHPAGRQPSGCHVTMDTGHRAPRIIDPMGCNPAG